jgi:hypothetical protein
LKNEVENDERVKEERTQSWKGMRRRNIGNVNNELK